MRRASYLLKRVEVVQRMTCLDKCFNVLMITIMLGVEGFNRTKEREGGVHSDPRSIMVPSVLYLIGTTMSS
jgi:hypothetical protein